MARLINAFDQFFDSAGKPLAYGKLYFKVSGSSTVDKDTYADIDETIKNENPVILSGDGRAPNVFGSESYRVILTDKDDVQILQRDPVGGTGGTTFGADWVSALTYAANDVVRENGRYWISLVNGNFNNQPSLDGGSNWHMYPYEFSPVEGVAALRGAVPTNGVRYYLGYHTTEGDGGHGWFRCVTGAASGTYTDNNGTIIVPTGGDGGMAFLREYSGSVNVKWFGAKGDGATDDYAAIQASVDSLITGKLYIPSGLYRVTQGIIVQHPLHIYGDGGAHDEVRTDFDGSWLWLDDSATLPADTAILTITHDDLVPSDTHRTFALVEDIGIYGNRYASASGHGIEVSAKNVTVRRISILDCDGTGMVVRDKDAAGSDNDGSNACVFENLWIGYNTGYGVDLRRDVYSGDTIFKDGHIFWNDDDGIYCNQINVTFIGVHVWWNLNGLTIDGTLGTYVQTSGVRIYDNAKSGIRLINAPDFINIAGDIHSNGRQDRIDAYPVPPTVTTNEKAAIYIDTPATNVLIDNLNVGYLKDSADQYYGVRCINSSARLSIGTVVSGGATVTQQERAIVLTSPANNATLHGEHVKSDMSHPGFIAKGDINLNGKAVFNQDKSSFWAWDLNAVSSGVITATSTTVALSEASPVSITDIAVDASFTGQLPLIIFRNGGANAVTFTHNTAKIRNISGANVVLGQHESIGYMAVSAGVYQQVMGKI